MRIGELAKASECGVETVRFYERKGLIAQPPKPCNGGYRSYTKEAAVRIRFIRHAQELGFSLDEIAELLSLKSVADSDCGEIRRRALAKRGDVDSKIARLRHIRATLTALIDACPGKGPLEFCSILGAMEPRGNTDVAPEAAKGTRRNGRS